ncbi:hypothetical protein [Nocardioides sp.]|uniref:hypothetical protein n=1 Tax=Nocardioides sp. TaxID=35761 RepID=UPI003D1175A2
MILEIPLAHGLGGAKNLPIPPELAIAGASAALTVSFIVLALAWRTPRFDAATQGRPAPGWLTDLVDSPAFAPVVRALGLLFFAYVTWAAVAGPDLLTNPVFGVVYVLLWVGLVPASLLFGPFYRAVSPVRTLHLLLVRVLGLDAHQGRATLPPWVGLWPGALALFAFVWLELVYPSGTYLATLQVWFGTYLVLGLVGAAVFGDRWLAAFDPFEVYSTLIGHLSVFGRRTVRTRGGPKAHPHTQLVLRAPLRSLDGVPIGPGLVAVLAVLLGSTAFDTFKDSSTWVRFIQDVSAPEVVNTLGLLGFCLAVGVSFTAATVAVRPRAATGLTRRDMPGQFAHSLVPIVLGYITAHYLSYFVEVGQQTMILLSDPMGTGANLLGTANLGVNYWLSDHPSTLAVVKVLAVVGGHVLGVIAAHDRATKLLTTRDQLVAQLPLLVLMVLYTGTGLYLLFGS